MSFFGDGPIGKSPMGKLLSRVPLDVINKIWVYLDPEDIQQVFFKRKGMDCFITNENAYKALRFSHKNKRNYSVLLLRIACNLLSKDMLCPDAGKFNKIIRKIRELIRDCFKYTDNTDNLFVLIEGLENYFNKIICSKMRQDSIIQGACEPFKNVCHSYNKRLHNIDRRYRCKFANGVLFTVSSAACFCIAAVLGYGAYTRDYKKMIAYIFGAIINVVMGFVLSVGGVSMCLSGYCHQKSEIEKELAGLRKQAKLYHLITKKLIPFMEKWCNQQQVICMQEDLCEQNVVVVVDGNEDADENLQLEV